MPSQTNFRVIMGIMIVLEAYILLNSSFERHFFQSSIVASLKMFNVQQFEYKSIQLARYSMIALMYTAGVALIFSVGMRLILAYCYLICILEGFYLMTGGISWRSVLMVGVYLGFVMIVSKFQDDRQKIRSLEQQIKNQKDTEKLKTLNQSKKGTSSLQRQ